MLSCTVYRSAAIFKLLNLFIWRSYFPSTLYKNSINVSESFENVWIILSIFLFSLFSDSHGQVFPTLLRTSLTVSSRWIPLSVWLQARHLNTLGSSAWLLPPPWRTCSGPFPRTSWRERHHAATAPNQHSLLAPAAPRSPARRDAFARRSCENSIAVTSSSVTVENDVQVTCNKTLWKTSQRAEQHCASI